MRRYLKSSLIRTLSRPPDTGEDPHCEAAARMIRDMVGDEAAYVQFLVGGTQANMTILSYLLRPHEGVISAIRDI